MKWVVFLVGNEAAEEIRGADERGALFLKEPYIEGHFPYLDMVVIEPRDTDAIPKDWT